MGEWVKHSDGWVCGDVGAFPSVIGARDGGWEVWVRVDGEWQEAKPRQSFETLDATKAAALKLAGKTQQ